MNNNMSALWWQDTPHGRKEHTNAVRVYDLETGRLKRTYDPSVEVSVSRTPYVASKRNVHNCKCWVCGRKFRTYDTEPDFACPECRAKPGTPDTITAYDRLTGRVLGQWHSLVEASKDMCVYQQYVWDYCTTGRQPVGRWVCWCFGERPEKPVAQVFVVSRKGDERAWLTMTAYAQAQQLNSSALLRAVREGQHRIEHRDGTATEWRMLEEFENLRKGH